MDMNSERPRRRTSQVPSVQRRRAPPLLPRDRESAGQDGPGTQGERTVLIEQTSKYTKAFRLAGVLTMLIGGFLAIPLSEMPSHRWYTTLFEWVVYGTILGGVALWVYGIALAWWRHG